MYNILIVDDEYDNRFLLREIVKEFTKNLYEADNGKKAIDILENNDIDIILMDVNMQILNGVEATSYIRSKLSHPKNTIPIIALTAYNSNMVFGNKTIRDAGFDLIFIKPYICLL